MRYEQWLKKILVNIVENNQLSNQSAQMMYERIVKKIFGEKRKNNDNEN